MNIKSFIFLFLCIITTSISAMGFGSRYDDDPFSAINYQYAFGESDSKKKESFIQSFQSQPELIAQKEIEKFQAQSFKQLRSARLACLTKDVKNEITYLLINFATVMAVMKYLPKESLGGSFSIFNAAMGSAYSLPSIIKMIYNLVTPPANSLEDLENQFARDKCFIPLELHHEIIQKFYSARTNKFEQKNARNFIEFALGLTLYKPKHQIQKKKDEILLQIKSSLFNHIDEFFAQYQEISPCDIWKIKNNIYSFVLALLGQKNVFPRYIHLHGEGGIGKTYFVTQLRQWIKEILPKYIKFESFVINAPNELEGTPQKPCLMLRILRNQLIKNRLGSLVFMDEAAWLSQPTIASAAKRVFNGDQTTIETNYFGKDMEGSDLQLPIPPMLIFVASNDEIKDAALKTRFDSIKFPLPTKQTLIRHAKNYAQKNALISAKQIESFNFEQWLEKETITNFRAVESSIIPALLQNDRGE